MVDDNTLLAQTLETSKKNMKMGNRVGILDSFYFRRTRY